MFLCTRPVGEFGKTSNICKKSCLSCCDGSIVRGLLDGDAFQETTLWDIKRKPVFCAADLEGNDAMIVVCEGHA